MGSPQQSADPETPPPSRRTSPGRWFDLVCWLAALAGFGVVLGPALVGRGALIDLDLLTRFQPWQAISGRETAATIICRGDTVDYYLPGIRAIKEGVLAGQWVTWAPYEVGGAPLAALPNHAALSPLSLPYYVLPLWLAPAFVKLLEVLVASAGMIALLGRYGVRRGPAAVASLVFVSTGFMAMWTNWPHTRVAALVPLLFWALERLARDRRVRDVVLLAFVVASMLLGGFPAVTLFAMTLGGPYLLVRVLTAPDRRLAVTAGRLVAGLSGVVLGLGLAAVQLLPFVRNLGALGLEERVAPGRHLPVSLFLTTVSPDAVGLCVDGAYASPVNPIEAVGFLGAAAGVLVLSGVLLRRPGTPGASRAPRLLLAVSMAVVVVLIWVGGPLLLAVQELPFYSSNSIGRAQSVFGFLGALLAGVGLDSLVRCAGTDPDGGRAPGRARWGRVVLVVGVLAATAAFAAWVAVRAVADATPRGADQLRAALPVPLVLLALAVLGVFVILVGPRRLLPVGAVALVLLVVGQSTAFLLTVWPRSDPDNLYPVTPTHRFLQQHLGQERYAAGDDTMYPATSDWYSLRTPVGHEFTDARWRDLLVAVDPGSVLTRTSTSFSPLVTVAAMSRSAVLDQLAVRYWTAGPMQAPGPTAALTQPRRGRPVPVGESGVDCRVPGGALRGVRLELVQPQRIPVARPARVRVTVSNPAGELVGGVALVRRVPRGPLTVPVVGEDLPAGEPLDVRVSVTGSPRPLLLRGAGEGPACAAVRPGPDGARLVHTGSGATVYERPTALPRIRWAGTSEVVASPEERLRRLTAGVPAGTVLLDDAGTPAGEGSSAELEVRRDAPEDVAVEVDATGGGYVVVADALVRPGWSAEVDGRRAPLVHGNHALAAVPVPAGRHIVRLTYDAPGLRTGTMVSAASGVLAVVLLVVPSVLTRHRHRHGDRTHRREGVA